jgi:hypothetical protein
MAALDLSPSSQDFIRKAVAYLENPSFFIRLANAVGKPLENAARAAPESVARVVNTALEKTMQAALFTVDGGSPALADRDVNEAEKSAAWKGFWHKVTTTALGGASGLFGLVGAAAELPITTGIMFRSIAAIAGEFGEDLKLPVTRLECLSVFSYGGRAPQDDALGSSYLSTRSTLASPLREAADFMASTAGQGSVSTSPVLVRLMAAIAARFNVVVTNKLLSQSLPILGAVTGAAVNLAFTDHFNEVARYHFGLRKLERLHGTQAVQDLYLAETRKLKEAKTPVAPTQP